MIEIGTDIAKISRIKALSQKEREKIFHPTELKGSIQNLAGIFAAKEALKKAFDININWLDIEIKKDKQGKPKIILNSRNKVKELNLSIAHDGDYAIATVICQK